MLPHMEPLTPVQILDRLSSWLSTQQLCGPNDVLIPELCFADRTRRADLVLANGRLVGFEIKSKADTLKRWQEQMQDYLHIFDEVWLCGHGQHILRAMPVCDPRVGFIVVDDFGGLAVLRPPRKNTEIDSYKLTSFLWREEIDTLMRTHQLPVIRKERIGAARRRLAQCLPLAMIQQWVLICLKQRYRATQNKSSPSSVSEDPAIAPF